MADIYLTNSLTRKKELFVPSDPKNVGMYTCGPTVYQYAHIGNFRTYVMADVLLRLLGYNSFNVRYVMNITDVGHLTGDNLGDADLGEDRMETSAKKEGKAAVEIARHYTEAFLGDMELLNIKKPWQITKATQHIPEQIGLIAKIEEKGLAYKISDGIYFDTVKYEKQTGKKYGELSTLDEIKSGARVEENKEKKNPRDFALWKFSKVPGERQMEWNSPWGLGFPGWHIECSAMSMKYLGESFDIHVGGEDLRSTHHPNEIAQSEAVTSKRFVKYWLHSAFLLVDSKKMSKSLGNDYRVGDLVKKGINPMALRYLYLSAHYRDPLNFTEESIAFAQNTYDRLRSIVAGLRQQSERTALSQEKGEKVDAFRDKFIKAVNDDLNTPVALGAMWEALKSNIPSSDKYDLVISFDEVLGLGLSAPFLETKVPGSVAELIRKRNLLRGEGKFKEADELRDKIQKLGFSLEDTSDGSKARSPR